MNKKDILELKRRFKKETCTFSRLCGCYVDGERNRVLTLGETFLNIEDEAFYKYLEIAKKVLSGTLGNNLLELEFPLDEEMPGGRQQFFNGLRKSALKNEDLLERFYDLIIENFEFSGNYLILLFHDAYDVIKKTSDNMALDESEEVYEYLLCAICPVALSKPGLGYLADENRFGARIRDWVVGAPESGFVFPAFTDRSADIHSVMTYHKNPRIPHTELMEGALGCAAKRTATEQKQAFEAIVKKAVGGDDEVSREVFYEIQQGLSGMAGSLPEEMGAQGEPVRLTPQSIGEIMAETDVPETAASMIQESYREEFQDEAPILDYLIDAKAAEAGSRRRQEKELVRKVATLEKQLADSRRMAGMPELDSHTDTEMFGLDSCRDPEMTGLDSHISAEMPGMEGSSTDAGISVDEDGTGGVKTYDVILRVKPEKASQIKSQMSDGRKCLVIPLDEDEHAAINGVNTTV